MAGNALSKPTANRNVLPLSMRPDTVTRLRLVPAMHIVRARRLGDAAGTGHDAALVQNSTHTVAVALVTTALLSATQGVFVTLCGGAPLALENRKAKRRRRCEWRTVRSAGFAGSGPV